ncbi:hypothetical protein [Endozoicomonas lisbonensis]|uniref:EF-hand domain-containing protein n=1 Tax=Endozoicomonas lisbonensis TaxID=3120522 RepID=A0ABV2SBS4_9GAMM
MKLLCTLLLGILCVFAVHAESGELTPGYATANRYYGELAATIDTNNDERLSYQELIEGYHAPHLNQTLYQVVRLYLVNFEALQDPVTATLNQASIELAELSGHALSYHHEQDNAFWEAWLAAPEREPFATTYRLIFPQGLTSITPDNILQRRFPDCTLIATLASMANSETGKRRIFNYFKYSDKSSVSVLFPGLPNDRAYIHFSEVEGKSDFATSRDGGKWVAILEAAYAHLSKYHFNHNGNDPESWWYHQYSELVGIKPQDAFKMLAGSSSVNYNPQFESEERLKSALRSFVREGKAAVLGIAYRYSDPISFEAFKDVSRYHAYSVIGYDEQEGVVYIRDPRGESSALKSAFSIIKHQDEALPQGGTVFEFMEHFDYGRGDNKAFGFSTVGAKRFAASFANVTAGYPFRFADVTGYPYYPFVRVRSAFQVVMESKNQVAVAAKRKHFEDFGESAPIKTGVHKMTIKELALTFNELYISQCGLNYCRAD